MNLRFDPRLDSRANSDQRVEESCRDLRGRVQSPDSGRASTPRPKWIQPALGVRPALLAALFYSLPS